jgi:hypothetical protein
MGSVKWNEELPRERLVQSEPRLVAGSLSKMRISIIDRILRRRKTAWRRRIHLRGALNDAVAAVTRGAVSLSQKVSTSFMRSAMYPHSCEVFQSPKMIATYSQVRNPSYPHCVYRTIARPPKLASG